MTIEGTATGTLAEAHELIDLVRAKNIAPPPIARSILRRPASTTCAPTALSGGWC
jgi:hypothetical protein